MDNSLVERGNYLSLWEYSQRPIIGSLDLTLGEVELMHGPYSQYYIEALEGLPSDVHPLTLGLKYIITNMSGKFEPEGRITAQSPTLASNDLVNVAKWLNETMTLIVPYYRSNKNEQLRVSASDMDIIVRVMKEYIVGPIGLEKMRSSLIAYSSKGGLKTSIEEKITSFLNAIDDVLSTNQLAPQYQLPAFDDVLRLSES